MQAFAKELKKVRTLDTENKFEKQLNNLEFQYQRILLQSLNLFHTEMLYTKLPDNLHSIKKKLDNKAGDMMYHTNHPYQQLELGPPKMPQLQNGYIELHGGHKRALLPKLRASRNLGRRRL